MQTPDSGTHKDHAHAKHLLKCRKEMILVIIQLLRDQRRRRDISLEDIATTAKKLEFSLYCKARSIDEYRDEGPLLLRVKELAVENLAYHKLKLLSKVSGKSRDREQWPPSTPRIKQRKLWTVVGSKAPVGLNLFQSCVITEWGDVLYLGKLSTRTMISLLQSTASMPRRLSHQFL